MVDDGRLWTALALGAVAVAGTVRRGSRQTPEWVRKVIDGVFPGPADWVGADDAQFWWYHEGEEGFVDQAEQVLHYPDESEDERWEFFTGWFFDPAGTGHDRDDVWIGNSIRFGEPQWQAVEAVLGHPIPRDVQWAYRIGHVLCDVDLDVVPVYDWRGTRGELEPFGPEKRRSIRDLWRPR